MLDSETAGSLYDRVYVISLPTSRERRRYITRHLAEKGISEYEFHDAIGPDHPDVQKAFTEDKVVRFPPCFRCGKTECGRDDCNNVLIPSQVAVFLSYFTLWQKIERRSECALVCEDDLVLHPWWTKVLKMVADRRESGELEFSPNSPSLIRLGWAENPEHAPTQPYRISREVRMSNPLHLITAAYAGMLVNEFRAIENTADMFLHRTSLAAKKFAWTAHPPAGTEMSWSRGTMESLIHPKRIRSQYLNSKGKYKKASQNDAKIENHIQHLFYRALLIVGGAHYETDLIARLLSNIGLDVGRETDGRDGIASWMFAANGPVPRSHSRISDRRDALRWKALIMPVRDIKDAVPFIMRENRSDPESFDFRRRHILARTGLDLDRLSTTFQRAVVSFLSWIRMVEAIKPDFIFRIESDCEKLYWFVAENIGIPPNSLDKINLPEVLHDESYRGASTAELSVPAGDWGSLSEELWAEVEDYCRRFNYTPPSREVK